MRKYIVSEPHPSGCGYRLNRTLQDAAVSTIVLIFIAIATPAWGLMVANPTPQTPYEQFGVSIELDFMKWKMRDMDETGSDYKFTSQRGLVKPSLGVFRFVDIYGYIGFSDLNLALHDVDTFLSDLNGSKEMAFGLGTRIHFAVFYPSLGCKWGGCYPIKWYADLSWLTYASNGEVYDDQDDESDVFDIRFQDFRYGLYGDWQFGRTRPYIGIVWTYMIGHFYWTPESALEEGVFAQQDGLITYPESLPKPVIGLDIDLGKAYYLSLEMSYWGKDETSIGIGLSRLYFPPKSEDEKEQTIERPEEN